jgi:hypothetical protein
MSIVLDEHTHQTRVISTFSQRENNPEWYVESYRSLREWVLRQSMYVPRIARTSLLLCDPTMQQDGIHQHNNAATQQQ